MFAYCLNNPVNYIDVNGYYAQAIQGYWGAAAVVGLFDGPSPILEILGAIVAICLIDNQESFTHEPVISIDHESNQSVDSNNSENNSSVHVSSAGMPDPPKKPNKSSLKRLTKYLMDKLGINPHRLKYDYLGQGAEIKLYDLAYDTITGTVYIITKNGQIVTETFFNVFEDVPLW